MFECWAGGWMAGAEQEPPVVTWAAGVVAEVGTVAATAAIVGREAWVCGVVVALPPVAREWVLLLVLPLLLRSPLRSAGWQAGAGLLSRVKGVSHRGLLAVAEAAQVVVAALNSKLPVCWSAGA